MAIHLKHGGSTAARTIQCPAWQRLSEEVPLTLEGAANVPADEGTMLHNCMEYLYGEGEEEEVANGNFNPEELIGTNIGEYNGQKLTQDLIDTKLTPAMNALEALMDDYGVTDWKVEPFVKIDDDIGGSIDFVGRSADYATVIIVDYKFGFVNVEVEDNAQAQFYALAAAIDPLTSDWFGPELETIVLAIIQPNDDGDDLQTWKTNLRGIDHFETIYLDAVDKSEDPESMPKSGPACKYCPAEAICPVKTGEAMKATRVNEITADKLAEYLPMAAEVEKWAKAVKKMAHEQLEQGVPIKGYKLIAKRASRVWNNTDDVENKVRKAKKIKLVDGFNSVLKSPAQLEKVCKTLGIDFEKEYAPMLSKLSSGTTLALESNKAPAALPLAGLTQLNAMIGGES
jgi:hypothetical protein